MATGAVPLVGSSTAGRKDERFQSPELERAVMGSWAFLRYGQRSHKWLAWSTDLDRSGVSIDRPALNDARDLAVERRSPFRLRAASDRSLVRRRHHQVRWMRPCPELP